MTVFSTLRTDKRLDLLEHHHKTTEYSYAVDCVREAELEYHKWYAEYVFEVQNYINSVAPNSNLRAYALVELCEKYKVDVKFALAQGEIESHFATTGLGAKICNVFNVGCDDDKSLAEIDPKYKELKNCPKYKFPEAVYYISSLYSAKRMNKDKILYAECIYHKIFLHFVRYLYYITSIFQCKAKMVNNITYFFYLFCVSK